MRKTFVAFGLASLLSLGAVEFNIDTPHSSVEFKVKHLLVTNVGGKFQKFSGKVDLDGKKLNVFEGQIVLGSVDTDNQKRDDHLRSAEFFNVKQNPHGFFKMTEQKGDKLYGVLTLNGISKNVVFDVEISDVVVHPKTKKNVVAIEIDGEINRKDFGIGSGTPDSVVGNKVKISLNFELYQK